MILIDQFPSKAGVIFILRSIVTGAYAYWQGDCCHSEIDTEGVSLAPYIHAIYDLIGQADARKILMIGCAGGTLATILSRAGRDVTVVDIEPNAFDIATRYFRLPPDVTCVVDDGLHYLLNTDQRFSAIVLDAFAYGTIPAHLRTGSFFAAVQSRLCARGHVLSQHHSGR
jgi:spermidine synthase